MQIIDADDTRMIDLPGVGPCPRPVDIDQRITGFKWLKSLRIYRFQTGPAIHGESEVDEVFIMALAGAFKMQILGAHPFLGQLAAEGPLRALYMTPHHAYTLTPLGPVLVAYARAKAAGLVPVQALTVQALTGQALTGQDSEGLAEQLRFCQINLAPGGSLDAGGRETLVHLIRGKMHCDAGVLQAGQTLALNEGEAAALMASEASEVLILSA